MQNGKPVSITLIKEFNKVARLRGNKALLMTFIHGKKLSNDKKDEMLICSRIAKHNIGE